MENAKRKFLHRLNSTGTSLCALLHAYKRSVSMPLAAAAAATTTTTTAMFTSQVVALFSGLFGLVYINLSPSRATDTMSVFRDAVAVVVVVATSEFWFEMLK